MYLLLLSLLALGRRLRFLLGAVLLLASAATTHAQQSIVYGLGTVYQPIAAGNPFYPSGASVGDQGITSFFTVNGTPASQPVPIRGVAAGQVLVGMDYRPNTGQLYALGYNASSSTAQLYILDPATGQATAVGSANAMALGTSADRIGFDFNPTVDRIRVVSADDANYRLNPNDGTATADGSLAYLSTDPNAGLNPGVGAVAYTNSFIGSTSTTLYDIDELNNGILAIQNPPNAGTLNTQATVMLNGFGVGGALAFDLDIAYASGVNTAYLVEVTARGTDPTKSSFGLSSSNLYDFNLATGAATNKRTLVPASPAAPFEIRDLAVPIAPPVCDGPTNALASAVTNNSATVSFTGSASATSYTVTTAPATTTQTLPATATSVNFAGLAPNTTYSVSIVSNCFDGRLTSGPATVSFTTLPAPTPTLVVTQGSTATANNGTPSYNFGNQLTGTTQTAVFTLTNSGADPLTISSISASNPSVFNFQAFATPATLAANGGTASLTVTYAVGSGAQTGTIALISDATNGNGTFNLTLAGNGQAPTPMPTLAVTQGSTSYASGGTAYGFGNQTVGSNSAPVAFTLTNNGPDPLTISNVSTTSDYALSGPAPTTVAANGGTATVSVTFAPTAAGPRPGTLVIASNATNAATYTVNLTGNGVIAAPNPSIAVNQGNTPIANGGSFSGFASTAQGSTSAATFTVANSGPDNLTLGTFALTGPFALSGAQPTSVAAGASVTFSLAFTPTAVGTNTGTLSIPNNSPTNNPYVINLSGQGTAPALTDLTVSTRQAIQGSYSNVTITGTGVGTLSGTLTVAGTLTVQPGGVLAQNCQVLNGPGNFVLQAGGGLAICDPAGIATTGPVGAVQVIGTRSFSPNASYAYNGTAAQVTGPGLPGQVLSLGVSNATGLTLSQAVSVAQLVRLQAGNLNTNGNAFTLLSSAAGTALVDNTGGAVTGTATVQRYIDPKNSGLGYRHYSAPVANSTVNDLAVPGLFTPVVNPAYNTVGNTATPFPNVYGYDETRVNPSVAPGAGSTAPEFDKGFFSPNSTGDALEVTRGYTVNITQQAMVDFVGNLNNGNLTASGLTRGGQALSGYHLRGNPYPAPLDWNLMRANGRLTNLEDALYVYKSSGQYTGSYASYVNGMGANGGTNVLPVAQGFLVRTAAGQTGRIEFTNAERLTTADNTLFQRGTADSRPQLTLALGNATTRTQAVMYFEQGATAAFDKAFDAHALPATNGLTLATETAAAEPLAINGQSILTGGDVLVPLRVAAQTTGTYTLAVDDLGNLPSNYHAYLRDALTSTYTDLGTTSSVSVTLAANGPAGGRYAVLFTTQARVLASAPAALARLATVYPNPAHGTATLLLPLALRGNQATAVSVVDNVGRVVLSRTLAAGTGETLELPVSGLAPGVYSVLARTAAGLVAKRLVVQ